MVEKLVGGCFPFTFTVVTLNFKLYVWSVSWKPGDVGS